MVICERGEKREMGWPLGWGGAGGVWGAYGSLAEYQWVCQFDGRGKITKPRRKQFLHKPPRVGHTPTHAGWRVYFSFLWGGVPKCVYTYFLNML